MARREASFICQNCGAAYGRWQGKCDACGEWNTIAEENSATTTPPMPGRAARKGRPFALEPLAGAAHDAPRVACGLAEFDRVTGGGFVRGSVLLLGGDPGCEPRRIVRGSRQRLKREQPALAWRAARHLRTRGRSAFFCDRVPFTAGVALALPAAVGRAAVLADETLLAAGHRPITR